MSTSQLVPYPPSAASKAERSLWFSSNVDDSDEELSRVRSRRDTILAFDAVSVSGLAATRPRVERAQRLPDVGLAAHVYLSHNELSVELDVHTVPYDDTLLPVVNLSLKLVAWCAAFD